MNRAILITTVSLLQACGPELPCEELAWGGILLWMEEDLDADGEYSRREVYAYDCEGKRTTTWRYVNGPDDRFEHSYDERGNEVQMDWFTFHGNSVNVRFSWTYDDDDNMLSAAIDQDMDGAADSLTTWTYEDGLLIERTHDWDGDGVPDNVHHYSYDADGNCISAEIDSGGDGSVDIVFGYAYDAEGRLVTETWDVDADGSDDLCGSYAYDNEGLLVQEEWVEGSCGSGVDVAISYTYDARDNLETASRDEDADGTVDELTTYAYDDDDNLVSEETDEGADGTLDERWSWSWDRHGNMVQERQDKDGDGVDDERSSWGYLYR